MATGSKTIIFPLCISCGRPIAPDERSVSFTCPSCGRIVIWRCEICRELGKTYTCPACGLEGP